jgi:hypothetical protein
LLRPNAARSDHSFTELKICARNCIRIVIFLTIYYVKMTCCLGCVVKQEIFFLLGLLLFWNGTGNSIRAFVLVMIHMYWVGLSRFKSITSQNPPQFHPIHSNTHVISITEQALRFSGTIHMYVYKLVGRVGHASMPTQVNTRLNTPLQDGR